MLGVERTKDKTCQIGTHFCLFCRGVVYDHVTESVPSLVPYTVEYYDREWAPFWARGWSGAKDAVFFACGECILLCQSTTIKDYYISFQDIFSMFSHNSWSMVCFSRFILRRLSHLTPYHPIWRRLGQELFSM